MRNQWMNVFAATVLACGFMISTVWAKEPVKTLETPDLEEMTKLMVEMGTPGREHDMLKDLVGEWDVQVTEYPMMPGMKESTNQGKSTYKALYGGRYIEQKFEGSFNGEKFEGTEILGYDKAHAKYTSVWIDNMSTQTMVAEGKYDPTTNTRTLTGKSWCPMGPMETKSITTLKSHDEFSHEMYVVKPEGEMKMMSILYTRKK